MREARTVAAVRSAEQTLMAKLPDGTLMQRAAAALASTCATALGSVYGSPVVVLVGSGDNGGDALYAGARLAARGAGVTAIAVGQHLHEAGAAALVASGGIIIVATSGTAGAETGAATGAATSETATRAATSGTASAGPGMAATGVAATSETAGAATGEPATSMRAAAGGVPAAARAAIADASVIIDGLTGIGGHGGLREPAAAFAWLTAQARADGAFVVAVDLPSGIDADTGEVHGVAVEADLTVTFGTIKPGLLIDPGASCAGTVELVDIGLQPYLAGPDVISLQAADIAAILPQPTAESDKYRRGVLGLVAGSEQYTGAAVLSCGGAIRGGAGMVRVVSAAHASEVVRQHWPEAVITTYDPGRSAEAIETAGRVQAWAVGPGLGTGLEAHALLAAVLDTDVPVLVDADGLTVLSEHRELLRRQAPTLITPHAGELSRLIAADRADIEARRLHYVRAAASELGVTVLLKGSTTVIARPDPALPVLVNSTGTSWLATAGSGDVLTGLAGAMLAQGLHTAEAAAVGAYLHGMAARLAARDAPIGASDIIAAVPAATRAVTGNDL